MGDARQCGGKLVVGDHGRNRGDKAEGRAKSASAMPGATRRAGVLARGIAVKLSDPARCRTGPRRRGRTAVARKGRPPSSRFRAPVMVARMARSIRLRRSARLSSPSSSRDELKTLPRTMPVNRRHRCVPCREVRTYGRAWDVAPPWQPVRQGLQDEFAERSGRPAAACRHTTRPLGEIRPRGNAAPREPRHRRSWIAFHALGRAPSITLYWFFILIGMKN